MLSETNIGHHMERKLRLRESKQLKKLDLIITATKVSIRKGQSAKAVFGVSFGLEPPMH